MRNCEVIDMTISDNGYKLMLFVQQRLYEGLEPDSEGYYIIRRKEFIERLPMKPSTFAGQINNLVDYYMQVWDLGINFHLQGLNRENLYVDVSYQNGKLRFRRNKYTKCPELDYVWARKPLHWEERNFVYEYVPAPKHIELPIKKNDITET